MRGRYRKAWIDQLTGCRHAIHCRPAPAITFKPGHRIWVPSRHGFPSTTQPQTFVPNIDATASDYRPQTHRIYRTSGHPSHVQYTVSHHVSAARARHLAGQPVAGTNQVYHRHAACGRLTRHRKTGQRARVRSSDSLRQSNSALASAWVFGNCGAVVRAAGGRRTPARACLRNH
jgi:hypothetical protein